MNIQQRCLFFFFLINKCPYKQRYITGSVECSTKSLTKLCCVEGREVECFNAIAEEEGPRLYVH
jgi:hypothetical protein